MPARLQQELKAYIQTVRTPLEQAEEPISLFVQPAGDLLPSPVASLITGIAPQRAGCGVGWCDVGAHRGHASARRVTGRCGGRRAGRGTA